MDKLKIIITRLNLLNVRVKYIKITINYQKYKD